MYCSAFALFLLSIPFLTQAGPVASGQSLQIRNDIHSTDLIARAPDDDSCTDTKTCKESGQNLWDKLQDKFKNGNDVTKFDGTLASAYEDRVVRDATPDYSTFQSVFTTEKLDFEKHFADHNVKGKDEDKEAFQNMFNTNQGTMIGVFNNKDYNPSAAMPFSEVVFQCYKKECDNPNELKNYQFSGVANVGNTEYLNVIEDLYKSRGLRTLPDTFNKWTYEDQKDGFLALLGTPKLSFVLRMLADHSVAFGNKKPTEVWTNYRRRGVYVKVGKA
ncbi:MAG: hypothetical protein Q9220_001768 [cf. Caloplaca sp. 1 TL-2023]